MARKFMNQKGQAYSTFQLLIAAVIAMAILIILIPIIMRVMGIITADPTVETRQIIGNAVDSPSALQRTSSVAFPPNSALSAQAITEGTGISPDQICMGSLDFGENDPQGFTHIEGDESSLNKYDRITYNGNSAQTVQVAVICNESSTLLLGDLVAYDMLVPNEEKIDEDHCVEMCGPRGKCCAIIVERD